MQKEILDFLTKGEEYTIICHCSPDGDTLGSGLALFIALSNIGKTVEIVCQDVVPTTYFCLPFANKVKHPSEAVGYKYAISVDCADEGRMGNALPLFYKAKHTLNLDHHRTNPEYAELNLVDDSAAAVAELVCGLLEQINIRIDLEMASCLYVGMMTDTGSFAFANTTPATMRAAANMMERGVNHSQLNTVVFRNASVGKKRLLGSALANLELFSQGRGAITSLSKLQIDEVGAQEADTEGIIDHLRDIDTVEVAILARESQDGIKVSMRSKGMVDVAQIARAKNGGGHARAAGYTVKATLEEAYAEAKGMVESCWKA